MWCKRACVPGGLLQLEQPLLVVHTQAHLGLAAHLLRGSSPVTDCPPRSLWPAGCSLQQPACAVAHPSPEVGVLPLPELFELAQRRVAALRGHLALALRPGTSC